MNKKISIIVPVYNVEKYVGECLDSLINQTYKDLEIICINDGSKDRSLEILKSYAQKDARVIVIDQENSGVSEARNRAMKVATGKYMMFADSDDWLELDACQILIDIMEQEAPDVIMYSYYREYENASLKKENIFPKDYIIFNDCECTNLHRRHIGMVGEELQHPENADAICSLVTTMYLTEYIRENQIEFIDMKTIGTNEDGMFNIAYFEYVKKAVFVNKHLYHYRKTNETSIVTTYKENLPQGWEHMFDVIGAYIQDKSLPQEFTQGLENRISLSIIGLGLNELTAPKSIREKYREIKRILNTRRYRECVKSLELREMPIHWQVFFGAAKYNWAFVIFAMLFAITKLKKVL